MHKHISLNRRIVSAADATIAAISSASLYGRGVFTTLAVYNAKPFQWDRHWQRLNDHAAKLGVDISEYEEDAVYGALIDLLRQNEASSARARITFFDETSSSIWTFENFRKSSLLITTDDARQHSHELRLTRSLYSVNSASLLAGIKSCNYLENVMALEEAKAKGFDECIRLNEKGEVTSAAMANIFWVNNSEIFTPNLESGCLAGTTRALVIEIANDLGYEVSTLGESFDEFIRADEVFLTSSGLGISGVRRIDDETFGDEVTKKLAAAFAERIIF